MLKIEFIYDSDCPNVPDTRENLKKACTRVGIAPKWTEWERSCVDTPEHVRQFGSPAILVNGRDIADLPANSAAACRIYQNATGLPTGVPPVELIAASLRSGCERVDRAVAPLKRHLALVPAISVALLPKLSCPACWPAYAGFLSAAGLGFLAWPEYLMPLTALFLAIVLSGLAWGAKARRGYGPLFLGVFSSASVLFGKFMVESDLLFYSGLAFLAGASLWNTWPRKESKAASCCECTPVESACEQ